MKVTVAQLKEELAHLANKLNLSIESLVDKAREDKTLSHATRILELDKMLNPPKNAVVDFFGTKDCY